MCFSQPASAGFLLMGLGTAGVLGARGHPWRRWQLPLYFAVMELLQFLSYSVVDDCGAPANFVLTLLSFAHISFQNVSVNLYFLNPQAGVHPDVTRVIVRMCIIGGAASMLTKLPWPVWLGASPHLLDGVAALLPEVKSLTTAGSADACRFESMCGPAVCTVSTPHHIGWMLPLMPPSYLLPNSYLHFFFFFAPTMLMANNGSRAVMLLALLTGPLATQLLAATHMPTYSYSWPATWCFLSVGQCIVALGIELWGAASARRAAQQQQQAASSSKAGGGNGGSSGGSGGVIPLQAWAAAAAEEAAGGSVKKAL